MNIEFHFNNNLNSGFIATVQNKTTIGQMLSYCKTTQTSSGYTSVFEIYIPYEAIGVGAGVSSVDFTARGWFETGWCDLLNNSWTATHTLTKTGITAK